MTLAELYEVVNAHKPPKRAQINASATMRRLDRELASEAMEVLMRGM